MIGKVELPLPIPIVFTDKLESSGHPPIYYYPKE